MKAVLHRRIKAFCAQIVGEAELDFDALPPAGTRLECLDMQCEKLHQLNMAADSLTAAWRDTPATSDAGLVPCIEKARDAAATVYARWEGRHRCAEDAVFLGGEPALEEAYATLLALLACLHNKLNTLGWMIGEDEAEQDKTLPGKFGSAKELQDAMDV